MNYYFITGTSSGIGKALVEQLLLDEKNHIFGFGQIVGTEIQIGRFRQDIFWTITTYW